eukprot:TRINITY_DN30681_c0_g1_i1.p1 TRINITY_DN30681_c0_g1~~TRINITY_DN30681_c0_g1_i1.p1  ORF type:complete len:893 (-),score=80.58 TRINITY_DN30681_c0_g1_i1:37-2715(-)
MIKKSLLLLGVGITLFTSAKAQPWLENVNPDKTKLADIIKAYEEKEHDEQEEEEEREKGKVTDEDKGYHFNRWKWHAEMHTDQNGYLVPASKNYEEWRKLYGNTANKTTAATTSANWTFQGPTTSTGGYAGIGRINSIAFHPTDANQLWVATAGGGAWKTSNNGASWTSMSHMLPVLGVSDIDINPANPNIIYMCTGDRDASDTYSIGVMKSSNGGTTWDTTGLKWAVTQSRLTNALVINKVNTNTLTVATSDGIYQSTNAGTTFTRVQTGNFKDIVYHPTDTNVMYAVGSALYYRSANGGKTWTNLSAKFAGKGRIALAVTPADVKIVKLIVCTSSNGLDSIYNSTDTGKTFTAIFWSKGTCPSKTDDLIAGTNNNTPTGCGNQGWYDLCIAINPNNANEVIVGGVNAFRSINGGSSWAICTQWWAQLPGVATVHADKHFMGFHPLVAGRLLQGCDGGIYRTDNTASTLWTDMTNGLGITQFYRNAVSFSSQFVMGGAQDNGTKSIALGTTWTDENGGDGMDCQVDFSDSTIYYSAVQNGSITRHTPSGNTNISDNIPYGSSKISGKGSWITPYIINPHNPAHIIAGYRQVYVSADRGNTWISLSGDSLNKNRNIHRLAMTPADNKTLYAILDYSGGDTAKVYYTNSYNTTTPVTFSTIVSPYKSAPSDIKVDPKKKDRFWLTFSGYGSPQVVQYDAGTWTSYNTGLPNVPVQCMDIDSATGFKYIGTDIGVYHWDTTSKQWEVFNNSSAMPSIEVTDLGINYKNKELWAATYGRGLWKSKLQVYPTKPVDTTDTTTKVVTIIPYADNNLELYPNPNNGVFQIKTNIAMFANKVAEIRIIDKAGRTVWQNEQKLNDNGVTYIRTTGLALGAYILNVSSGKDIIGRQRFLIE